MMILNQIMWIHNTEVGDINAQTLSTLPKFWSTERPLRLFGVVYRIPFDKSDAACSITFSFSLLFIACGLHIFSTCRVAVGWRWGLTVYGLKTLKARPEVCVVCKEAWYLLVLDMRRVCGVRDAQATTCLFWRIRLMFKSRWMCGLDFKIFLDPAEW